MLKIKIVLEVESGREIKHYSLVGILIIACKKLRRMLRVNKIISNNLMI